MDPADIDFNSSDEENDPAADFADDPFRRFDNAGRRTVEQILLNQATDRRTTKAMARNLSFACGSPYTAATRMRVKNTFNAFLETVRHDPLRCPTGELIFRFIATLVTRIRPPPGLPGKSAPSLSTIRGYWYMAIRYLSFEYPDLKENYGPREVTRIDTMLRQQVTLGNIFKGKWRARQWIGFQIVHRMAKLYLWSAVQHGVRNFDVPIQRLLGIALQVACSSRAGDIARSDIYRGYECLCWKDIQITLPADCTSVQDFQAKIVLRFAKGHKDDVNQDRTVFFDPLNDAAHSSACAVKLVLIHALRHGQCHGTTIQEVIAHTSSTNSPTIQWRNPDLPVLGIILPSNFIDFSRPASPAQLNDTLRSMAILAELVTPVTTHDLRRGSARDLAFLPKAIQGTATSTTAFAIGHNRQALGRGVTQAYVGPLQETTFNARAESGFKDRLAPVLKDMEASEVPLPIHTVSVPKFQIDNHINNLEQQNSSTRDRYAHELAARQIRATSSMRPSAISLPLKLRRVTDGPAPPLPLAIPVSSLRAPLQPLTSAQVNVVNSRVESPQDASPALPQSPPLSSGDGSCSIDDNEDLAPDPVAMEALKNLLDPAIGEPTTPDDATQDLIMQTISSVAFDRRDPPAEAAPWLLSADAFVEYFASINVYRNLGSFRRDDPVAVSRHVPTGNSRANPTPFLYHCGVGACSYVAGWIIWSSFPYMPCSQSNPASKHCKHCTKCFSTPPE